MTSCSHTLRKKRYKRHWDFIFSKGKLLSILGGNIYISGGKMYILGAIYILAVNMYILGVKMYILVLICTF